MVDQNVNISSLVP